MRRVAFVPSRTDFINEVKTILMKWPMLVLIKLVNENKQQFFLCVGENFQCDIRRKASATPTLSTPPLR